MTTFLPQQYGSFVKLVGLVGSKKYNGSVGRVESEPTEDSKGVLRIKVALVDRDKTLQVRPSNISASNDSSNWNRWECNNGTILVFFRNPKNPFHSMDVCHEFGIEAWKLFFDPAPSISLPQEQFENFKQVTIAGPKHALMIVNLSAVGHVFVMEMKGNGRFRIYQSYVKQRGTSAALHPDTCGYSVGEWCSPCTATLQDNEAHRRYGGGKTLNATETCTFLDLIYEWQTLTVEILAEELLIQVPEKILPRNLIPYIASGDRNWIDANHELFTSVLTAINNWSVAQCDRIMKEGITVYGSTFGKLDHHDVENVSICIGSELLFTISAERFLRCNRVNMSMTGQCVGGGVFLKMLQQGICWDLRAYQDSNGHRQFVGFSFQAGAMQ
jgi:hypothetical protein